MSMVTPKQIAKTINTVDESGIDSDQFQSLLGSGNLTVLLHRFMKSGQVPHMKEEKEEIVCRMREAIQRQGKSGIVIIPLDMLSHGGVSLLDMIEAGEHGGHVNANLNEENFPMVRGSELLLACFNREIGDSEDPTESELLQEMDKLELQAEGPFELAMVGMCFSRLERMLPIVARRQIWRNPDGVPLCPIMQSIDGAVHLNLRDVNMRWKETAAFLTSHK